MKRGGTVTLSDYEIECCIDSVLKLLHCLVVECLIWNQVVTGSSLTEGTTCGSSVVSTLASGARSPRFDQVQLIMISKYIRIYFNIVDLCGILPYKRMYPYKCDIKINFDILTTQKDQ